MYVYGCIPKGDIDHKNGDRDDNRIENLRCVSRRVNLQNQRKAQARNKTSGLLGVFPNHRRWSSKININGHQKYLGTFDTPEQAYEAYVNAKRIYHEGNML